MVAKDSEFHKAIFKTCGNQCLCDLIEFLHTKAHIVRYYAWANPQRIEQSILEHQQMIQAVQERNRITLEKLVVNHLALSHKSYLGRWHFSQKDEKGARLRSPAHSEKRRKIFTENSG
jgi:DNA-binding FadR family transcriptional regulator